MTPSSLLFLTTLILGTLITLSSTNWMYLWMGMELNLLSFIPIIAASQSFQETEASVKYFIIQAVGSGIMLTAGIMSMNPIINSKFSIIINLLFIISMVMKLGMAPFHQWMPHVMSSVSWTNCIILSTWQKISPLFMLMFITPHKMSQPLLIMAALSAIVGGVGGLNQSQMRALLAYSSIGHMAWMTSTITLMPSTTIIYLMIYMAITISLMMFFIFSHMLQGRPNTSMMNMNKNSFMMMIIIMFSLGGLPPLLGFIPKWLVINSMMLNGQYWIMVALITGSLISLFYYLNMMFNFMLTPPQISKHTKTPVVLTTLTILSTLTSMLIII
nr:NADH dehydrogenase subunit 2 [Nereididae sp. SIO BIC A9836]